MSRTKQQQQVIDAAIKGQTLIKVPAVAGSGKTFTLIELAKELQSKSGLYLAYNKAIADEATAKFEGTNIKCSTIHALAYSYVVRPMGLKVGYFSYRNVKERLSYHLKVQIVDAIEQFCLSAFLDPNAYATAQLDPRIQKYFLNYLDEMANGDIPCTHSFYLKMFHLHLHNGTIVVPEKDLLLVDEAGDITELTLEIFKLLNAKIKIAVGDPMQNIYSFNNTINAFTALKGKGVSIALTESFRVSKPIAKRIEHFVRNTCDKDFSFIGHDYKTPIDNNTKAYISRNNSGLLEEMFRLMESNTKFHTTRSIDVILKLPLILANLNSGNKITEYEYKHIEALRSEFERTRALQDEYSTASQYVRAHLTEDEEVKQAFKVVIQHGPYHLNKLAKYAKECLKQECDLTLTTAHSSKGLEFNIVEIAPDLNLSCSKALTELGKQKKWSDDYLNHPAMEELRLYYVACSRSMTSLIGASMLD